MKKISFILCFVVFGTANAAGLGGLFGTPKTTTTTAPKPQPPKTVPTPILAPKPQPAPVVPKPTYTPVPATQPLPNNSTNPTTSNNITCSPTDSSCKK